MSSHDRQGYTCLSLQQASPMAVAAALLCSAALIGLPQSATAETETYKTTPTQQQSVRESESSKGLLTGSMRSNLPAGMYKASKLIGKNVKDSNGKSIGEIKDLALQPDQGNVGYAVLSFGGMMGIGDKLFAIQPNAFQESRGSDDVVLNISESSLKQMQGFDNDNWPTSNSVNTQNMSVGPIVKASEYLEYEVKNFKGEDLGEIEDLAIDLKNGKINYAVIEHGGVLGIGEKLVAVPTASLTPGTENDEVILGATEEELDKAKGFSDDNWPVAANSISDLRFSSAGTGSASVGAAAQSFTMLDKDDNGYVSRSEATQLPRLQQRYDVLDKNGDGKLDRAEFAGFETGTN